MYNNMKRKHKTLFSRTFPSRRSKIPWVVFVMVTISIFMVVHQSFIVERITYQANQYSSGSSESSSSPNQYQPNQFQNHQPNQFQNHQPNQFQPYPNQHQNQLMGFDHQYNALNEKQNHCICTGICCGGCCCIMKTIVYGPIIIWLIYEYQTSANYVAKLACTWAPDLMLTSIITIGFKYVTTVVCSCKRLFSRTTDVAFLLIAILLAIDFSGLDNHCITEIKEVPNGVGFYTSYHVMFAIAVIHLVFDFCCCCCFHSDEY